MASTSTQSNKILTWVLGALASLSSYVAWVQNKRVEDIEKVRTSDKLYYQAAIDEREKVIIMERKQKDSLQGLILTRTDKSVTFEQLQKLLDIKNSKSTITITPKNK